MKTNSRELNLDKLNYSKSSVMNNKFLKKFKFLASTLLLAYLFPAPHAFSQRINKQSMETEAHRLSAVRTLIGKEKSRRLRTTYDNDPKISAALCERMLNDLLNHNEFKAIEPAAVLDFEYPLPDTTSPKTQRQNNERIAKKKLDPELIRDLKHCAAEERGDALKFSGFNPSTGAPPFRIYMLPDSINPFPESKLVYWSEYVEKINSGRKGYSWVNLDICEHTNEISDYTDSMSLKNDTQGQRSSLTTYQNKLVAWSIKRNQSFFANLIKPKHQSTATPRIICHWETFK